MSGLFPLPEAPVDGNSYLRRNAGWIQYVPGGLDLAADYPWTGNHSWTQVLVASGGVNAAGAAITADTYNGVALTAGGPGTNYLADDGTYKPVAGGGGGVGKGTPFDVGELTAVSSATGDGEIVSSGITTLSVSGHLAATDNPHQTSWTNLLGKPATFPPEAHTHAAADIVSGTFADLRIAQTNVTQHQAALSISWSQITATPTTLAGYGITDGVTDAELAAHAALTNAVHGLVDTGPGTNFLADDGTYKPAGAGSGTYNEVEEATVSQSVGRAKLNFIATGDATVDVADDAANDRTTITIDATAGTGGGGISKGTTFVADHIMAVQTIAGDGTAYTFGTSITDLTNHLADGTIHFTEASIDHTAIQNVGTNTHVQIDSHIADGTIHYAQTAIDHTVITNRGTNTHAQIDSHIADGAIHFTVGSIDHTAIQNVGTNTHVQIDSHIADGTIHFADATADGAIYSRQDNAWVLTPITPVGGTALAYTFSTNTTSGDPGSGNIRVNNADMSLATEVYVSDTTRIGNNADPAWQTWREGDYIQIVDEKNSRGTSYRVTGPVVDNTTWYILPVSALTGGNNISNNRDVVCNIVEDPNSRIPVGGTVGQYVRKQSSTNYDTLWEDLKIADDPTPTIGGDLNVPGTLEIVFKDQTDTGQIGFAGTISDDSGVFLAYNTYGVAFALTDAALTVTDAGAAAIGPGFRVESLANANDEIYQVLASPEGYVFGSPLPTPGWEETATDALDYDLGTGTGVGAWVKVANCEITVPQDVAAGDRLDVWSNVDVVNKTTNRSGTISFGFGIDGNAPLSAGEPRAVSPGFAGYIPTSLSTTTHGGLTTGQTIGLWARRESGDNSQFGVDLIGSLGDEHELIVSVPSQGGGSGEANTGLNVGTGAGVFRDKTTTVLNFRSINGTDCVITENANDINVDAGLVRDTTPQLGGSLDAQTNPIGFTENTSAPTGVLATIDFNNGNHATLDLSSATGAVTATLVPPPKSAGGRIIVKQGVTPRDVTWDISGGVKWAGTEPDWASDSPSSFRIVSWTWDGTQIYLVSTPEGT